MKAIKTYPSQVEADLARIALDAAGVPSVVVGIGVGMEGGMGGVQLLVPDFRLRPKVAERSRRWEIAAKTKPHPQITSKVTATVPT